MINSKLVKVYTRINNTEMIKFHQIFFKFKFRGNNILHRGSDLYVVRSIHVKKLNGNNLIKIIEEFKFVIIIQIFSFIYLLVFIMINLNYSIYNNIKTRAYKSNL